MHWQFTPYTLPLLLTSLIAASLTGFAGRKRTAPGAIPFIWLMFALTLWSLGYALELASANLAAKLLWTKVEYIGILIVPTAFLSFTLQHTRREKRLTRRNVRVLALIPLITFLVVWTNDYHRLFHHHTVLETSGPFSMLDITYGPFFWLHTAYSYTLLAGGTFLLLKEWRREMKPLDMAPIVTEALHRLAPMIKRYHAQITVPEIWPTALGHAPWVEPANISNN